ncbi:phosphate signaling complex PhoU family protein [Azospirillum brasilense]|uniref:phosphate signaling complex PhoU family protein n=1 Tax=Azospirillum brasilense TaxID=192 RepID=UPI0020002FE8|nr:PhoU domain-containing protein [Azospirillum brasilense]
MVEADAEIDRLELELELQSVRLLALCQPMAKDLRDMSPLKIASHLERMGDFTSSVAKRAVTLAAYDGQDAERAMAVSNRDGQADAAYTSLFRAILTYMMESPAQITGCTHLLFVAKSIESAGDNATNRAENIRCIVQGRLPSEERSKGDTQQRHGGGVRNRGRAARPSLCWAVVAHQCLGRQPLPSGSKRRRTAAQATLWASLSRCMA